MVKQAADEGALFVLDLYFGIAVGVMKRCGGGVPVVSVNLRLMRRTYSSSPSAVLVPTKSDRKSCSLLLPLWVELFVPTSVETK